MPRSECQYWATLDRKKHIERLSELFTQPLSADYEKLAPSQTWTVYWGIHSLALLEQDKFIADKAKEIIQFIAECAHPEGGYGGGPGQVAHVATSYAAVNALLTISGEEALDSIDRVNLVRFLHRMKRPDGSYAIHDDGEVDARSTYCALAMLYSLNIHDPLLLENVADWLLSCQSYEGGFGSVPGSEAHGGYTFCCVASLHLLNQLHRADLNSLLRWLTNKQLADDGGFSGRSNKLVDSCYSYWQGAVLAIIHPFLPSLDYNTSPSQLRMTPLMEFLEENGTVGAKRNNTRSNHKATQCETEPDNGATTFERENNHNSHSNPQEALRKLLGSWLFDESALQDYLYNQCQSKAGLLRDKPQAVPDFYHTCYALSGLSISQHEPNGHVSDSQQINQLAPIHPVFNVTIDKMEYCIEYFKNKRIETIVDAMSSNGKSQNDVK